jgi:hypothetical protein
MTLQITANLPSHVTNCGNGWFSKITHPNVNAREICESYGYTGIDMYGGNSGTLCSSSKGRAGSCGWDDGYNCGQTVDWHCVFDAPILSMSPIVPYYGNDILFTCATNTDHDATGYQWYKNGILESSSSDNTLAISSATHVSDGNWVCVASFILGDSSLESNTMTLKINTNLPTNSPSKSPTHTPSQSPSFRTPSQSPSFTPTNSPSKSPTHTPSQSPLFTAIGPASCKTWTDYENQLDELPQYPWGETCASDSISFKIVYNEGLSSWATWSGVSNVWDRNNFGSHLPDTGEGFLRSCDLWYLYRNKMP